MSLTQQQKDFKKLDENLKKTNFGQKFVRKLFTDPDTINSKMAMDAMRYMGLNIPRDVQLTVEAIQAITVGQAAIQAYQAGKDFSEVANLGLQSAAVAVQLADQMGWIQDKDGDIATTLIVAGDVCTLVATQGTDWKAYVSLALTAYVQNLKNDAMSAQLAKSNVMAQVQSYIAPQATAFAQNMDDFQKGKIGVLGWIAKNALEAPYILVNNIETNSDLVKKVPFLSQISALPHAAITYSATATTSDTVAGMGEFNSQSESFQYTIETLSQINSEDEARSLIFKTMIEPYLIGYDYANSYFKGKLSIENLSILFGIGAPAGEIYPNESAFKYLEMLQLTPGDMDDDLISKFVDPNQKDTVSFFQDAAISLDGVKTFSKKMPSRFEKNKQNILMSDQIGFSKYLYSFQEVRDQLTEMCRYPFIKDNAKMGVDRSGALVQVGEHYQWWRKLSNFAIALQYIEMIRKDPYFFDWEHRALQKYQFMKDVEVYQAKFEYLFNISLIRRVNTNAKGNLARYLNTTPDKLIYKNVGEVGKPAIYTIK